MFPRAKVAHFVDIKWNIGLKFRQGYLGSCEKIAQDFTWTTNDRSTSASHDQGRQERNVNMTLLHLCTCNHVNVRFAMEQNKPKCCMHITSSKGSIVPFSHVSWEKFKQCLSSWKDLDCHEGETAKKMTQQLLLNTNISLNEYLKLPIAATYSGYHRECYMRFTDKCKIQRAMKRKTEALNSGNLTFPFWIQDKGYEITMKVGCGYHIK